MTDTQAMAALEVTQADREAALAYRLYISSLPEKDYRAVELRRAILAGEWDHRETVQAFARHRIASKDKSDIEAASRFGCGDATSQGADGRHAPTHSPDPDTIGSHIGNGGRFDPAADEPVGEIVGFCDEFRTFRWLGGMPPIGTTLYAAPVPPPAGDAEVRKTLDGKSDFKFTYSSSCPKFEGDSDVPVGYEIWVHGSLKFTPEVDQGAQYALAKQICEQANAALATPSGRAQAWKPIETAPKDGTWLLCTVAGYVPETASWDGDRWIADEGQDENTFYNPTHWQPLPATPPAQDQKGDEA